MTRGRAIAYRLYLSAMVLLIIFGLVVVVSAVFAFFHDERVTQEDRACFERELAAERTAELQRAFEAAPDLDPALPPLPPGAKLDPPVAKKLLRRMTADEAARLGAVTLPEVSAAEAAKMGLVPDDKPAPAEPLRRKMSAAEATKRGFVPVQDDLEMEMAKAKARTRDWRSRSVVVPTPPPGFKPLPDGWVLDQQDDDWERLPTVTIEACHFSIAYHPEGRSSRAWLNLTGPETALSVFAFIPAAVLWGLARWVRWIFKPVAT